MKALHTVLGASGAVGQAVIKELINKALPVRAISRSKSFAQVEQIAVDLNDPEATKKGIQGSSHVYLCIGLPYRSEVWRKEWPAIMHNVIEACLAENAVLVFLDNIYLYGPAPLAIPFREDHAQLPQTKKGKTRKEIADMLLNAIQDRGLIAVIGRSADFYGPGAINSTFYINFLDRMLVGKAPQSIYQSGIEHTYANVTDNGRALVQLALNPDTYGSAWHLPVGEAITIDEICTFMNQALNTSFQVAYMPKVMARILSLFIPVLKEAQEMTYQFEQPYLMSYDRFLNRFPDFKVTPYKKGIEEMIASFQEDQ